MQKLPLLLLTCLLIFQSGCNPDRVPGNVIDEDKMAEIIVDIHLAEAVYFQQRGSYRKMTVESLGYYKSVLDKHDVTEAEMDSTIKWYANHPKVYLKVYDKVIATLSEREAQVQNDMKKEMDEEKERKANEIKDLWTGRRRYLLPSVSLTDNNVPFQLALDSLKGGQLAMSVDYSFKKEDLSSLNELLFVACYADSTRDTTIVEIPKSFTTRKTYLNYDLKDSVELVSVEGLLLKHLKKIQPYVEISEIQLQYIPRIDTLKTDSIK